MIHPDDNIHEGIEKLARAGRAGRVLRNLDELIELKYPLITSAIAGGAGGTYLGRKLTKNKKDKKKGAITGGSVGAVAAPVATLGGWYQQLANRSNLSTRHPAKMGVVQALIAAGLISKGVDMMRHRKGSRDK